MKCTRCTNELLEFVKEGEIVTAEYYPNEDRELVEFEEGYRHFGEEYRLSICPESYELHVYWCGQAHYDTYEYDEVLEKIELEKVVSDLARILKHNPECIDFENLRKSCDILKINLSDLMECVAIEVINQNKPSLYPRQTISYTNKETGLVDFSEIDDDDIPF